jgi:HK97 family phage major capsid protein
MELETMLTNLQGELKGFVEKAQAEQKTFGATLVETKAAIEKIQTQVDAIDVQLQKKALGNGDGPPLIEELKSNKDIENIMSRKRGTVRFDLSAKAANDLMSHKNISSAGLGFPTYGVMPAERDGGMVWQPRPKLRMLDVIPSRPTSLGEIYWVTESVRPTKASPVTEYSGLKPLVEPTFSTDKEPVQTIAVLMLASNQVLADMTELEGFLRNEGAARVAEELDLQILSGSGTPPNLNGVITQAQSWDLSLLTASDGYEYQDILAGAQQQVAEDNELQESPFYVLHPGDAWKIRRNKDTTGRYIFDGPQSAAGPLTLWGAPCVESTQITKGTFLYGSGSPMAAEYRSRMGLTVELSTEDSTNFRYNLVTIRFELRGAMVVKRPNAFVTGSLTQSPA